MHGLSRDRTEDFSRYCRETGFIEAPIRIEDIPLEGLGD